MMRRLFQIINDTESHFEGQQTNEIVVLVLRRHKFTVLFPIGFILLFALIPVLVWQYLSSQITAMGLASLFFFAASLFYLLVWTHLFYLLTIYGLNTVIVTDKRIIENEQHAFFHRKVSELHTNRVQDVSARTHGFLETFIGFGDIVVQTAASEREFVFHRIGNPEQVKDAIMKVVAAHPTAPIHDVRPKLDAWN
jgi:predicted membrane protein